MVNVTLAIQYYKESNKHTQKLINVKRRESKALTFHKVPASKEGMYHNGCGQVNKEWRRSRILPGVGYPLESDITHDPGRLQRSGENSHKSSTENHETSHRHSLSSLSGFVMVSYWFSENKLETTPINLE